MSPKPRYLRPNAQRADYAIYALYLVLALQVGILLTSLVELYLLDKIAADDFPDATLVELTDTAYFGLMATYLAVLFIAGITFIRWFYGAYQNLHQLPVRVRHGDGWAIGGWFVPILNLIRPYQMFKELHVKSEHLLRGHPLAEGLLGKSDTMGLWWGMWVVFSILGQVSSRMSDDLDSIAGIQMAFQMNLVLYGWGIPTAYLAIRVIQDYAAIERALRTLFTPEETLIIDSFRSVEV